MNLSFSSAALTIALFSTVGLVHAGPLNSCTTQGQCINFTKELITTNLKCGGVSSEYKICAILDLTNPSCTKKEGTVSHTCVKSGSTCNPTSNSFVGATEFKNLTSGAIQCQTAAPGTTVQFLFKDGSGCSNSMSLGSDATLKAQCQPRTSAIKSCTGNGISKECIWTVDVPPTPGSLPDKAPVAAPFTAPVAVAAPVAAAPSRNVPKPMMK